MLLKDAGTLTHEQTHVMFFAFFCVCVLCFFFFFRYVVLCFMFYVLCFMLSQFREVTMEELQAQVQPKQANPSSIDKLDRLVTHIELSMESPSISPIQRFILARDQAYFKAVLFSGDMGQVKVPEILRFPNNDGSLFNHIWGKTLCDGHSNVFGIQ